MRAAQKVENKSERTQYGRAARNITRDEGKGAVHPPNPGVLARLGPAPCDPLTFVNDLTPFSM